MLVVLGAQSFLSLLSSILPLGWICCWNRRCLHWKGRCWSNSTSLLAGMWRMRGSTRVFGICILQILLSKKQLRHAWSWIGSSALAWYFFLGEVSLTAIWPTVYSCTITDIHRIWKNWHSHWSIDIYCWIFSSAKGQLPERVVKKKRRSVSVTKNCSVSGVSECRSCLKVRAELLSRVVCFAVISAKPRFFILYSNLMPISLYAAMEICNFFQADISQNCPWLFGVLMLSKDGCKWQEVIYYIYIGTELLCFFEWVPA